MAEKVESNFVMNALLTAGFEAHSLLSFYQKHIEEARNNVKRALALCNNPYIAFSTGKDSVVMADLVWQIEPSIPAVYFDADASFPESKELLKQYKKKGKTIIEWKTESLLNTMARVGGPRAKESEAATMRSTVYKPVKEVVETFAFDCAFVGVRAGEGINRKRAVRGNGVLFYSKRDEVFISWPIAWLTFNDVWAYIVSNRIDYCTVYDKMFEMGLHWNDCRLSYCYGETKATHGRWAILARGWPELFNKFAQRFPEVREYI